MFLIRKLHFISLWHTSTGQLVCVLLKKKTRQKWVLPYGKTKSMIFVRFRIRNEAIRQERACGSSINSMIISFAFCFNIFGTEPRSAEASATIMMENFLGARDGFILVQDNFTLSALLLPHTSSPLAMLMLMRNLFICDSISNVMDWNNSKVIIYVFRFIVSHMLVSWRSEYTTCSLGAHHSPLFDTLCRRWIHMNALVERSVRPSEWQTRA